MQCVIKITWHVYLYIFLYYCLIIVVFHMCLLVPTRVLYVYLYSCAPAHARVLFMSAVNFMNVLTYIYK